MHWSISATVPRAGWRGEQWTMHQRPINRASCYSASIFLARLLVVNRSSLLESSVPRPWPCRHRRSERLGRPPSSSSLKMPDNGRHTLILQQGPRELIHGGEYQAKTDKLLGRTLRYIGIGPHLTCQHLHMQAFIALRRGFQCLK